MTERLADVSARIHGISQLGAVVNAMRGIAAARAQQARRQLVAIDAYAAILRGAIGQALPLIRPAEPRSAASPGCRTLVLFCAEQGFAGAFSEHVLDAVGDDLTRFDIFLIGSRGRAAVAARHVAPAWTDVMPSHSPGIPRLADRIMRALTPRIAAGEIDGLDVVFSRRLPGARTTVERRTLFPFDTAAVAGSRRTTPPLLNLAPETLLEKLTEDYMLAELCTAALHAFAAENEARVEAMAAARTQVESRLSRLQATQRRVSQEEITAEIIELAAGEAANRGSRR